MIQSTNVSGATLNGSTTLDYAKKSIGIKFPSGINGGKSEAASTLTRPKSK